MVQETTSGSGDGAGWANLARSKTEQRATEGCSPERVGRLLEGRGNASPRWMIVARESGAQNPAYRPAHSLPDAVRE